jgi:hypothetical protein
MLLRLILNNPRVVHVRRSVQVLTLKGSYPTGKLAAVHMSDL